MNKVLAQVALGIGLALIQPVLLRHLGGGRVSAALALPVVVWLGLHASTVGGAAGAAAIGWALDAASGATHGLHAFLAVLLFLVSRVAGAILEVRGRLAFAVASGAGTLFFGLGALLLWQVASTPEATPGWRLAGRVAVEAVVTGLVAPAVRALLVRIDRLLSREEPGLIG